MSKRDTLKIKVTNRLKEIGQQDMSANNMYGKTGEAILISDKIYLESKIFLETGQDVNNDQKVNI